MTNTPLILKEIPKDEAISFIRQYHYSKILPRLCKYFLGIFSEEKLLGVVELGWGTQPLQTIRKLFPDSSLQTTDYLEIGKMCFLPEMNQTNYFGSQALSALIKWLKEHTDCHFYIHWQMELRENVAMSIKRPTSFTAGISRQVSIVISSHGKRYTLEVLAFY